jgi:hypothetical protein
VGRSPAVTSPAWRGPGLVSRWVMGCAGSTTGPRWMTAGTALAVTGCEDQRPAGRVSVVRRLPKGHARRQQRR